MKLRKYKIFKNEFIKKLRREIVKFFLNLNFKNFKLFNINFIKLFAYNV